MMRRGWSLWEEWVVLWNVLRWCWVYKNALLLPMFFVPRVFLTTFLCIAAQSLQLPSSNSHQGTLVHTGNMAQKIAAAHLLISSQENDDWAKNTFPKFRLDAVDHLLIAPFHVGPDGKFILEPDNQKDLHGRLVHVIAEARKQAAEANHKVKIFALQWWRVPGIHRLGTPRGADPKDVIINEEMYKNYINSVPGILDQYGFDGWAVDYEHPDDVSLAPRLFHDVKVKLQAHGNQQSPKRENLVAISPSETHWLIPRDGTDAKKYPVSKSVDYVYLQTYEGGLKRDNSNGVDVWLNTIQFPADRLLAGVITEERGKPISAKEAREIVDKHKLAGIHVWRLNGNTAWSNEAQATLFNYLHPEHNPPLPQTLTLEEVDKNWM